MASVTLRVTTVVTNPSQASADNRAGCDRGTPLRGSPPVTSQPGGVAGRIDEIAEEIERLIVSHRRPEKFFEDKSDIAHRLRQVASEVRYGTGKGKSR
jgi:hypothetical protein